MHTMISLLPFPEVDGFKSIGAKIAAFSLTEFIHHHGIGSVFNVEIGFE